MASKSNGIMEQMEVEGRIVWALEAHGRHESNSKQTIDNESWRAAGKAEKQRLMCSDCVFDIMLGSCLGLAWVSWLGSGGTIGCIEAWRRGGEQKKIAAAL